MFIQSLENLYSKVPKILEQVPYLKLLILFGSRAKGDNTSNSDWDFAFLCDENERSHYEQGGWDNFRISSLLGQVLELPSHAIDIVDLNECPELLAHQIAQDGRSSTKKNPASLNGFDKAI